MRSVTGFPTFVCRHSGKSRHYVPARPTDQPTHSRTVKNGGATRRPSPRHRRGSSSWRPSPSSTAGAIAPKRTVGESVDVRATIFADGHDVLRAVVKVKAPQSRKWRETPLVHVDKDVDGDTFEGSLRRRCARPLGVDDRGVDRSLRLLARGAAAQGPRRPARSGGRAERGRRPAPGRRAAREGRDRSPPHRARDPHADRPRCAGGGQARRRARPRAGRGDRPLPRPHRVRGARRAVRRSTSTASWRASAPGTSSSHARGAASRAPPRRSHRSRRSASTSST